MLRQPNTKQNWTILSSLYDAAKQKELKKLRLAKCSECGRATPYRLKSLQITTVSCKRCGTFIRVRNMREGKIAERIVRSDDE